MTMRCELSTNSSGRAIGPLGTMSGILGAKHANIINLQLVHRDGSFQTFHLDIEVHDLAHLHAIIAALRDAEPVSSVERI